MGLRQRGVLWPGRGSNFKWDGAGSALGEQFQSRLCRRREWESGSLHGEGPSSKDTGGLLRGDAGQVLGPHGECDGGHELILGSRAAITEATEWAA